VSVSMLSMIVWWRRSFAKECPLHSCRAKRARYRSKAWAHRWATGFRYTAERFDDTDRLIRAPTMINGPFVYTP
jgi:hypothetical protein